MNTRNLTSNNNRNNRIRFNPIKNLKPESLARALDSFEEGRLSYASRIFEAILKRDDMISALFLKRKKTISRLDSEIILLENSKKAIKHKNILKNFYANIKVKNFEDKNQFGGLRLLLSQMMDSVAYRYSVHKIDYQLSGNDISAEITQYPIWLFENTSGKLRMLENEHQLTQGNPLPDKYWMTTCAEGLMLPSSIAYLYKQLALKDWIVYCERNGMPGIKIKTDAFPGSQQWENACQAVAEFGSEFHAVISEGSDIEAIDISSKNDLPYPSLVERMDRVLSVIWRGSDLSSLSADTTGASLQSYENTLIEEEDAANINDTLNRQIDNQIIKLTCGDDIPLAKFRLKPLNYNSQKTELELIERLTNIGLKPDFVELAHKFAYPLEGEISSDEIQ